MKNNIWFFVYYDILFYLCKHKEKSAVMPLNE